MLFYCVLWYVLCDCVVLVCLCVVLFVFVLSGCVLLMRHRAWLFSCLLIVLCVQVCLSRVGVVVVVLCSCSV